MRAELGIVDVGGARFKAGAWRRGELPVMVSEWEFEAGDAAREQRIDDLTDNLRILVGRLRGMCPRVVAYGGGRLRDPYWHQVLVPIVTDLVDETRVLTEHEEGKLLLDAAQRTSGVPADHLLDIGGKSVQLVSRDALGEAKVASWRFGTHQIEEDFGLRQASPLDHYNQTARQLAERMNVYADPGSALAIGTSRWYRPLMSSLTERLGFADATRWSVAELEHGWQYCAQLDPSEFPSILPGNPGFMYGADKGLLIASLVGRKLGAGTVYVTDATVMMGMALLNLPATVA